jgi:hypothetical protein
VRAAHQAQFECVTCPSGGGGAIVLHQPGVSVRGVPSVKHERFEADHVFGPEVCAANAAPAHSRVRRR